MRSSSRRRALDEWPIAGGHMEVHVAGDPAHHAIDQRRFVADALEDLAGHLGSGPGVADVLLLAGARLDRRRPPLADVVKEARQPLVEAGGHAGHRVQRVVEDAEMVVARALRDLHLLPDLGDQRIERSVIHGRTDGPLGVIGQEEGVETLPRQLRGHRTLCDRHVRSLASYADSRDGLHLMCHSASRWSLRSTR
jgi:hypothetical protein